MLPIIRPRAVGGTSVMTVVMRSGIITAVPAAWITRATISTGSPGEMAAVSVPRENSVIARMKIGRVLMRWIRKPVTGIITAIVNRKAVVSQCGAVAGTARLAMSCGRATAMIVSLRITTNAETSIR